MNSLTSCSRAAMMAAAGILVGGLTMSSAKAADLGGDCCADLEERVAELEATTARKGNRRMSLTVSGQVSRMMLYYNDGRESKTIAGIDNRENSTRFIFSGNAKVTPKVTAGFEMMVDIGLGTRSDAVSQAPNAGTTANAAAPGQNVDGGWGGDSVLSVRTANWYLQDKDLGRLTVGRVNAGGAVTTIDLGGIGHGAASKVQLIGGALQFRNAVTGALSGLTVTHAFGHNIGGDRLEGIVWESPSLAGFLLRAAWGENDLHSYSVRYAGEFGDFQVAGGIGAQIQSRAGQLDGSGPSVASATGLYGLSSQAARPVEDWGAALSLKHKSSGIFVQGHYAWSNYRVTSGNTGNNTQSSWLVQGGISRNWFGPGATAVYAEYGEGQDNVFATGANLANAQAGVNVKSDATNFGLGVNQKLDAAAMEIYAGWRRFSLSTTNVAAGAAGLEDMDIVYTGARIRF